MCGMRDNPVVSHSVPLQECVTRLGNYDEARTKLAFSEYTELSVAAKSRIAVSGGYVIAMGGGKVTIHRPASKLRGIEARTWSFSFEHWCLDAGVDSERDLLVIVTKANDHQFE